MSESTEKRTRVLSIIGALFGGGRLQNRVRRVVALFSHKWMIFDLYNRCGANKRRGEFLAADRAEPSAGRRRGNISGSTLGPVPNIEYGDQASDPRIAKGEDGILDLTQDALRYYDTLYDKRRELSDEVKAESGECEFKLGQSLRLT